MAADVLPKHASSLFCLITLAMIQYKSNVCVLVRTPFPRSGIRKLRNTPSSRCYLSRWPRNNDRFDASSGDRWLPRSKALGYSQGGRTCGARRARPEGLKSAENINDRFAAG